MYIYIHMYTYIICIPNKNLGIFSAPGLLGEAEEMFQDVLEHCREALGVGAPGDFTMGSDRFPNGDISTTQKMGISHGQNIQKPS